MTLFTKPATVARLTITLLGTVTFAGFSGPAAQAQFRRDQPRYQHAMTDLRMARAYLSQAGTQYNARDQRAALTEVDKAIQGLRRADTGMGEYRDDLLGIQGTVSRRERIRRAIDLLDDARRDLQNSNSDRDDIRWKRDVLEDIDNARDFARRAAREDNGDGRPGDHRSHPRFMRALSDLRAARELLRTANNRPWQRDRQREALEQVDIAIRNAQDAARQDDLDLSATPSISDNGGRQDRLDTTLRLLRDAHDQLTDNREGRRGSERAVRDALRATDAAAKIVSQIRDDRHRGNDGNWDRGRDNDRDGGRDRNDDRNGDGNRDRNWDRDRR